VVGGPREWQTELRALLAGEGCAATRVETLDGAVDLVEGNAVHAVFLSADPLAASDLLLLRRIRELAPRVAVVVVARAPSNSDLKRAFESGATAFLSLPASAEAVRRAIGASFDTAGRSPLKTLARAARERREAARGRRKTGK
jgi:DNA-binding NtrC family response regulator